MVGSVSFTIGWPYLITLSGSSKNKANITQRWKLWRPFFSRSKVWEKSIKFSSVLSDYTLTQQMIKFTPALHCSYLFSHNFNVNNIPMNCCSKIKSNELKGKNRKEKKTSPRKFWKLEVNTKSRTTVTSIKISDKRFNYGGRTTLCMYSLALSLSLSPFIYFVVPLLLEGEIRINRANWKVLTLTAIQ